MLAHLGYIMGINSILSWWQFRWFVASSLSSDLHHDLFSCVVDHAMTVGAIDSVKTGTSAGTGTVNTVSSNTVRILVWNGNAWPILNIHHSLNWKNKHKISNDIVNLISITFRDGYPTAICKKKNNINPGNAKKCLKNRFERINCHVDMICNRQKR